MFSTACFALLSFAELADSIHKGYCANCFHWKCQDHVYINIMMSSCFYFTTYVWLIQISNMLNLARVGEPFATFQVIAHSCCKRCQMSRGVLRYSIPDHSPPLNKLTFDDTTIERLGIQMGTAAIQISGDIRVHCNQINNCENSRAIWEVNPSFKWFRHV